MIATLLPEFTRQSLSLIDRAATTRRPLDVADLIYLCTQCADWLERLREDVNEQLHQGIESKLLTTILDEGMNAARYAHQVMGRIRPLSEEPTSLDHATERVHKVHDDLLAWKTLLCRPAPMPNPTAYVHSDPPEAYVDVEAILTRLRAGEE
jgi:hypothetical protein